MQLLVEPNYRGKETQQKEDQFADSNVEVDTATQLSLMQSSSLLQKAMKLLQADYEDLDPKDPGSVQAFKGSISIAPVSSEAGDKKSNSGETKIYEVAYTSDDPAKTQAVLGALKQVYLQYNLAQQKQRLDRGLSFINDQLPKIDGKVKQSEAALEEFRRSQELIDPESEAKARADAFAQLQQQQEVNAAQIRELQTRYNSVQQQVALSPQQAVIAARLSQSTRYQALLNEIQRSELAIAQQRLRFTDKTPFVQQALEQRQKQVDLLREEVSRVIGSSAASANQDALMQAGQLGDLDLTLIGQLVDAQINLQAAQTRYFSLANTQEQLRSQLKQFPKLLAQYGRLQPEVELNRDTLKQLLKAKQDLGLEIARGGFAWQVVEEPQLGVRTGPNLPKNLMLAGVVGLLLGGAAAFARETMDDAVHNSDDLKRQSSLPLLGVIPEALASEKGEPLSLPFPRSPEVATTASINHVLHWQPMRESLDLLYQNIQLLSAENPLESLVITSALAGEGKSMLALGLAMSAARLHQRVLLIDADLRRPSLHKLLNLPNSRGLSSLLTSNAPLPQQVDARSSSLRNNIAVLTAGATPPDPAKLLSSPRMKEIMATFKQTYDLILIDAPPVIGMVDAVLAAGCCDGVVMVGRIGQVTRTELTQATNALSRLNVIGVVANGAHHVATSNVAA
jgi:capsular exopolysaccharide synthesis family protein